MTKPDTRHPSTELGDEVERVARFLEPDIMAYTTEAWKWRQDQERKYARRLLDETGIAAALRQSTRSVDDGWRDIATAPKGDAPKDTSGPPILIWQKDWPTGYEGFWYAHDQCWMLANLDSEYGSPEYPTHWQPLPHPPSTEIKEETK